MPAPLLASTPCRPPACGRSEPGCDSSSEHLGKTFVRNASTLEYEVSDRTGAPSNGVRFIVYTVNPISGQPVTPLQEVGYADVEVTQTANSASIRIELVSGNVTYLDYTVGATASQTAATINVSGFVSNGEDRVNFDLDMHLNSENIITFDYALSVPTRGKFRMDLEEEWNTNTSAVTSSLELRGPHGTVTIVGRLGRQCRDLQRRGKRRSVRDHHGDPGR